MKNLSYTIHITAPVSKVWSTLLDDVTYREWSATFMPGSYYEGDWSEGSVMRFLTSHPEDGTVSGMLSRVKKHRPQEFISLEHYAEIRSNVETAWPRTGFENYTVKAVEGGTELTVDMLNVPDEYASMFDESWPPSLGKVKELAETAS